MNKYTIHHRIDTLLHLDKSFTFKNVSFSQWDIEVPGQEQTGWLATKNIDAENINEAHKEFFRHFVPLVDLISVAGQAHTSIDHQPFAITKENQEIFYGAYFMPNIVPLVFGDDEIKSLKKLNHYNPRGNPFSALSEAIRATTGFTRLAMLAAALEGFAGELTKNKTDLDYVKSNILKDEKLYEGIFKQGEGIRHIVLHGKPFPEKGLGDTPYNAQLFDRIIDFLNSETCANLDKEAKGRPRTRGGAAREIRGFWRWKEPTEAFCPRLWLKGFDIYMQNEYAEQIDNIGDF